MSAQGFLQVCQHRPALQNAASAPPSSMRPHKTTATLTRTPERTLPPQHRTTQHCSRMIVRRLHALDKGERPQRCLPSQQLPARPRVAASGIDYDVIVLAHRAESHATPRLRTMHGCASHHAPSANTNSTPDNANKSSPIRRLTPRRSLKARKSRISCANTTAAGHRARPRRPSNGR